MRGPGLRAAGPEPDAWGSWPQVGSLGLRGLSHLQWLLGLEHGLAGGGGLLAAQGVRRAWGCHPFTLGSISTPREAKRGLGIGDVALGPGALGTLQGPLQRGSLG